MKRQKVKVRCHNCDNRYSTTIDPSGFFYSRCPRCRSANTSLVSLHIDVSETPKVGSIFISKATGVERTVSRVIQAADGTALCRFDDQDNWYETEDVLEKHWRLSKLPSLNHYTHRLRFPHLSKPDHEFLIDDGALCVFPAFTADTLDPLLWSIEKWRFIVEALKNGDEVNDGGGSDTCALCQIYNAYGRCDDCPVAKFIGTDKCCNTPYTWWLRSKSLVAAKAELGFLREVLRWRRANEEKA